MYLFHDIFLRSLQKQRFAILFNFLLYFFKRFQYLSPMLHDKIVRNCGKGRMLQIFVEVDEVHFPRT